MSFNIAENRNPMQDHRTRYPSQKPIGQNINPDPFDKTPDPSTPAGDKIKVGLMVGGIVGIIGLGLYLKFKRAKSQVGMAKTMLTG